MSKEAFIRRLFDTITPQYDLFNRVASLGLDQGWRRRTVDSLQLLQGMTVLDLASGTGDLAAEEARRLVPLGKVVACDLSRPMLVSASRKLGCRPLESWHLVYAQGAGEALPFSASRFDSVTIGFALRNVSDLDQVFRELARVLRPGGRVALLEFGRPRNRFLRLGQWLWLTCVIPPLGLLATGKLWPFLYLRRSILQFISPEEVVRRMQAAGLAGSQFRPLHGGVVVLYTAQRDHPHE